MGESSDEENESFGQVFVKDEPKAKRQQYEPTEEELAASRATRLSEQSHNPNYLKAATPKSPSIQANGVDEIPVQAIDLDVPLHIPGLASADSYFNLDPATSKENKKKKKKKNKKKVASSSEEEEEEGPNIAVSKHVEMPEGASVSDLDDDQDDVDDPHRALAQISLEDLHPKP